MTAHSMEIQGEFLSPQWVVQNRNVLLTVSIHDLPKDGGLDSQGHWSLPRTSEDLGYCPVSCDQTRGWKPRTIISC